MSASSNALEWVVYAEEDLPICAEVFRIEEIMKIGDICPECGEAAVVNEEGCTGKVRPECYACGFSEC